MKKLENKEVQWLARDGTTIQSIICESSSPVIVFLAMDALLHLTL